MKEVSKRPLDYFKDPWSNSEGENTPKLGNIHDFFEEFTPKITSTESKVCVPASITTTWYLGRLD